MMHSFNVELAKVYGIECAIILHDIYYWVKYNEVRDSNLVNGRHWTYNTRKSMAYHFPYWSNDQIKRFTKKLIDAGLILVEQHNKKSFDHTLWYSLTDQGFVLMDAIYADLAKSPIRRDEIANAIPNTVSVSSIGVTGSESSVGSNSVCSPSINRSVGTEVTKNKYGEHQNVLLTDEEYRKLKERFPAEYQKLIDDLSWDLATVKRKTTYKNHYLTILKWARNRSQRIQPMPQPRKPSNEPKFFDD